MGSGEIGLQTLQWLANSSLVNLVGVVTQPDKPVGRSQVLTAPPPKKMAIALNLPILQPLKIRRTEELDRIRELSPDLIVVMAYGQILPKALLEMPTLACLNLHASILPRHRGAAPIQAAILAGDQWTGITIMYMSEGLDTGDILLSRSIRIRRRETAGSLHDRLANLGPEALGPALDLILSKGSTQSTTGRVAGELCSQTREWVRRNRLVSGLLAFGSTRASDGPLAGRLYVRSRHGRRIEKAQGSSGFTDSSSRWKSRRGEPGCKSRHRRFLRRWVALIAGGSA